jgi:hypothetical protein
VKHDDIFEPIDPPSGGLATLRARMEARPRVFRRVAPLAFAAAAVALVVLYFTRRESAPDLVTAARMLGGVPEIALGLAPMPGVPVAIAADDRATTALAEVRTANPSVAFYLVSSTTWKE